MPDVSQVNVRSLEASNQTELILLQLVGRVRREGTAQIKTESRLVSTSPELNFLLRSSSILVPAVFAYLYSTDAVLRVRTQFKKCVFYTGQNKKEFIS